MEELDRGRERRTQNLPFGRRLALCLSRADAWPGIMSWTAAVVRGIERGIKLPLRALMVLANDTGQKVICHLHLLQFQPPQVGLAESLDKMLPADEASNPSFLLVLRPAETIRLSLRVSNKWGVLVWRVLLEEQHQVEREEVQSHSPHKQLVRLQVCICLTTNDIMRRSLHPNRSYPPLQV